MALPATTEPPVTLDTLLARLEEITPIIEEHRDESEELGRLSDPVVAALKEGGFLRLHLPKTYGGYELDPVTFFRISELISRVDSSVGWQVGISNALALFSRQLTREGTDLVFGADQNATVCGSFNSVGSAARVDGGFRLTAQSPFNSGCRFADWCIMQGAVEGSPAETPDLRAMYCAASDLEIVDNWDVIGMRGTGSNDVRVEAAYVPEALTFSVGLLGEPPTNPHYQGDLYRMPLCVNVPLAFPCVLGSLKSGLDWVRDLAQNKTPIFTTSKLRDRSISQIEYGRALGRYHAAYDTMEAALARTWEVVKKGDHADPEQKARLYLSAVQAMELAVEGVRLVASVAGTSWIRGSNPVERAVRDVEVMRSHGYANESRFGTVAQVFWGLEPDFLFISV